MISCVFVERLLHEHENALDLVVCIDSVLSSFPQEFDFFE